MCDVTVPDVLKLDAAIDAQSAKVDTHLNRDIFRSLPLAEFNALPRLSHQELQKTLDAGRPSPPVGGGWNPRGSW